MTKVKSLGEKIFYKLAFENGFSSTETVELLTGDFGNQAVASIASGLEYTEFKGDIGKTAQKIWSHIKDNWDSPHETLQLEDEGGKEIKIEIEKMEYCAFFSHAGCDLCADGLGNTVYQCIAYDDAKKINAGEYRDIDVCGECIYEYYNGGE